MATQTVSQQINSNIVFISCSFEPRSKSGTGCYLKMSLDEVLSYTSAKKNKLNIITHEFTQTTPSRLEVETVNWALESIPKENNALKLFVCTDLFAVQGLLKKREKLEQTEFAGMRPGTLVTNADLFKEYYAQYDRLGFEVFFLSDQESELAKIQNMSTLMVEVRSCSREIVRLQVKEATTDKIADKWF